MSDGINSHENEPPNKRRRLSSSQNTSSEDIKITVDKTNLPHSVGVSSSSKLSKESDLGIQEFINKDVLPFIGVLKTRYSDFVVNEILPSGEVVHLRSTRPSKPAKKQKDPHPPHGEAHSSQTLHHSDSASKEEDSRNGQPAAPDSEIGHEEQDEKRSQVSEEQLQQLVGFLNEKAASEILDLHRSIQENLGKKANEHPTVRTEFTSDRSVRAQIHQFIRETFNSTIDSSTDNDGVLVLTAARTRGQGKNGWKPRGQADTQNRRSGKLGWIDRGGEYVHFTLYKENKDTMEAISWLTKQLKCNTKSFQFAGTKDRRAITSQRCSVFRVEAERLAAQNQTLRGSKIGDFQYHRNGLELGELGGNEFVVTLRDCHWSISDNTEIDLAAILRDMQQRISSLRDQGFLNYYGEQRFGTFSVRTDVIGRHILKEDFGAACDAILSFQADALEAAQAEENVTTIGQDDKNRALAIHRWRTEQNLDEALSILPRKFSAESQLMRHLHRHSSDYLGGLMTIQRNLRLMYVHAYQSLVWNMAATNRMTLYGRQVVAGDLVLVNEHKDKEHSTTSPTPEDHNNNTHPAAEPPATLDADGDPIIAPQPSDRATHSDDIFERARALTESEAASGAYTIFDIVLPQPGYDILYPSNASGDFYKAFMARTDNGGGGLDPYNMRRRQREFSLSGSYRKVVARIGAGFEVSVHRYQRDEEQFVKSDLDLLREREREEKEGKVVAGDATTPAPSAVLAEDSNGLPTQHEHEHAQERDEGRGSKVAVVLKFQLGRSQYATMALRELSHGGISPFKPEFSGGR